MIIDITIPTKGNTDGLVKCVDSIMGNKFDKARVNILVNTGSERDEYTKMFSEYGPVRTYHINFTNIVSCWNDFVRRSSADAVLFLCDDTTLSPKCLQIASKALSKFKNLCGVVGLNVDNYPKEWYVEKRNGRKAAYEFQLVGRAFYKERFKSQKPYCLDYYQFWAEQEFGQFAASINEFKYCKGAHMQHWHPGLDPENVMDTGTRRSKWMRHDTATHEVRNFNNLLWGRDFRTLGKKELI